MVHNRDRLKIFHNPLIVRTLFIILVTKCGLQKPSRPYSNAINPCLKSLNPRVLIFPIKTLLQNIPLSPSYYYYYCYNYSYFTRLGQW